MPETRATQRILLELVGFASEMTRVLEDAVAVHGVGSEVLTNRTLDILLRLNLDGPMTIDQMASVTGLPADVVADVVDHLEELAVIERRAEHDGGVQVGVTATGAHVARSIAEEFRKSAHAIETLADEIKSALDSPP